MKKKNKLRLLSFATGAFFVISFKALTMSDETYLSHLYDLDKESILSEDEYDFQNYLIDDSVSLPLEEYMVPQGISLCDDYYLNTLYDFNSDNNSIINVLDKNGILINTCDIGNKAHVGGIAYDKANKLVWVSGQYGEINAYSVDSILNMEQVSPMYSGFDVGNGLNNFKYPWINSVSYLAIKDDELFVGNFALYDSGLVKRYKIKNIPGKICLEYIGKFNVPRKVQGISFYESNNQTYILFNRSYGSDVPSVLQIFKYDENILDYSRKDLKTVALEAPPMLEQGTVLDNYLYSIFESAASPYSANNEENIDSICVLDVEPLVKRLTLEKDTTK